jgi:hypothetical protein
VQRVNCADASAKLSAQSAAERERHRAARFLPEQVQRIEGWTLVDSKQNPFESEICDLKCRKRALPVSG